MLKKIMDLVTEMDTCVLATIRNGRPYCSLMAYVADESAKEIYMLTDRATTKYSNIMENPYVSLLIDTRERHGKSGRQHTLALTVSGTCRPLSEAQKREKAMKDLLKRHPQLMELAGSPGAEVISVSFSSFLLLEGLDKSYFEEVGKA
ncbi:MAG: pyridoxamine 5'-phosphate oxidase family protein [Desulfobacteraceae bacterium]|jgi:nitroimidazol reductase NimA-like FMN-containing flavoprotein (pyridoxamine 5'-phosphate oxidase superfamily)|nr:MAG: pyridoxamine 5'-phosphate oxidase family protein [Desulfobacteraceae bacterium]